MALGVGSIWFLPHCAKSPSKWRFFTASEALLIDSLAEQIIPTDE